MAFPRFLPVSDIMQMYKSQRGQPGPHLPRLKVSRDEALAHDGLQDLSEHPLVVVHGVLLQKQQQLRTQAVREGMQNNEKKGKRLRLQFEQIQEWALSRTLTR